MAKKRKQTIPFERMATEVDTAVWEWHVADTGWQFHAFAMGLNLAILVDDAPVFVVRVKDINQAGVFAEGHHMGFAAGNEAGIKSVTSGRVPSRPQKEK